MSRLEKEPEHRNHFPLHLLRWWHQNLKEWGWYLEENPNKLSLNIQAAVRRLARKIRSSLQRLFHNIHRAKSEVNAQHFPESEHLFFQIILFIWGILPMASSLMIERITRRRKRSSHRRGRFVHWFESLQVHPVLFLSSALCIAALAVCLSLYTLGLSVSYDGVSLGNVSGKKVVTNAEQSLQAAIQTTLNDPDYTIDTSLVEINHRVVARKTIESSQNFEKALSDQVGLVTYAYTLYVNNEPIAATTYAGALEELLEQLKIGYISTNTVDCYFEEDVDIREGYVSNDYVMNLGYIAELLNQTRQAEVTHVVASGETYADIAAEYDITTQQLISLNPGYDTSSLCVGDELLISNAVRYLTVVNVERQSYVTEVPYDVTYQDDDSMYQGDYKVLSAGTYGVADVTNNVTYINGEASTSELVASVTLQAPVTEVQARGTVARPSWYPTGSFSWPCTGTIQSYFGKRASLMAGMTSNHGAIDISNSYGTPIYASDGGTVSHAGWSNGLGYLVVIDHNNGFQTYYGHNSQIYVTVGEHVYKGQKIAAMGSTGISTGTHCHFAIKIYGTAVDPLNYLP